MNVYITDALAREHQATLLADAAANRAAHRAGAARRERRVHAARTGGVLGRPFVAVQHWIASGQM